MHLLQAGNPPIVIRDILGHADIESTEVCARADMEMKRRALEKAPGVVNAPTRRSWQREPDLLAWLLSLRARMPNYVAYLGTADRWPLALPDPCHIIRHSP